MKYQEDVERIFTDDIREKRKAGRGAFSMRGKGVKHGFSGALRTPYHFMTTREKKQLNGEVTVTNLFSTIMPYEDFRLKDTETQKNLLTKWREVYDNDKIIGDMGIPKSLYFKLANRLDLPKKMRGGNRTGTGTKKQAKPKEAAPKKNLLDFVDQAIQEEVEQKKKEEQIESVKPVLITKGLHLEYNGDYDADSLNKIFTKLQLVVDGEPNKYRISISLSEIVKD